MEKQNAQNPQKFEPHGNYQLHGTAPYFFTLYHSDQFLLLTKFKIFV